MFDLELKTDSYPEETSWTLENDSGEMLYNISNYTEDLSTHVHNLCLPVGCYDFTIYDSYGDGIKEEVKDDDFFYYNPNDDDFYYDPDDGHYKGTLYGQQRALIGGTFYYDAGHTFCGVDVCNTPSPTSIIDHWLVGNTVVTQNGSNYFDGAISVTNSIGSKVKDPVTIKLFSKNCDNESTPSSSQVVKIGPIAQHPSFSYVLNIDQSLIGADVAQQIGTYITCLPDQNSSCSRGSIEFCTRVSTHTGSIEVAFRETNFKLDFDLTDNNFNVTSVGIADNSPDSFNTDVGTDFDVEACQCDSSLSCLNPVPISQNENLVVCLKPIHNFDQSVANNVKITNFNIKIFAGGVEYDPVWFSTGSYQHDILTSVFEDSSKNTIRISAPITAQFFIKNHNNIGVSGNAFLEFKSAKEGAPSFAGFMMEVRLAQVNQIGCFQNLIQKFHSKFAF